MTDILADPGALRRDLREDEGGNVRRRRAIVSLSFLGIAALGLTSLLQMGMVRHLPDPPLEGFDSDRVNLSDQAYRYGAPDGTFAVASFAANVPFAAFGDAERFHKQPIIPLLAAGDATVSAWLLWDMPARQKAWCAYCCAASVFNFGIFALTLPEATAALRQLRSGSGK